MADSLHPSISVTSDVPLSLAHDRPSSAPLVDVGMPAYRRPEFIGEAIESVLAQTHTNWRLLVSENGPGGGEVEAAVSPYTSDPRIRFAATGKDLGPPANWTRLVQAGTAPYFTADSGRRHVGSGLPEPASGVPSRPSLVWICLFGRPPDRSERPSDRLERTVIAARDVADVLAEGIYSPHEYIRACTAQARWDSDALDLQSRRHVSPVGA